MNRSIPILGTIFFVAQACTFAQDTTANQTPTEKKEASPSRAAPNDALLEYSKFLREESKDHRSFLESYFNLVARVFIAIAAAFGAILTWLNWKSKQDVRRQVDQQFRDRVESIVTERADEFQRFLEQTRKDFDGKVREINQILLSLSRQRGESDSVASEANALQEKKILWVDDYPSNNEYPMQILKEQGVRFTLAQSTEQAIENLKRDQFDMMISDMGRGGNPSAGLDLLQKVGEMGITTPVIVFSSNQGIRKYGERAKELGAKGLYNTVPSVLKAVQDILAP